MDMTLSIWIALASAVVAGLSFADRIVARRSEDTRKSIKEVDQAWKDEFQEMERQWREERTATKQEFEQRMSAMNAKMMEQGAAVSQLKLEFVQATVNVPTREQLGTAIDAALSPVIRHMERTERFMERMYEHGAIKRG